jgi:hypothetical protein
MSKYRTTEDIVIPFGTEIDVEPPHSRNFVTAYATVLVGITAGTTAEFIMDLQEALESGLIEEAEDEENESNETN